MFGKDKSKFVLGKKIFWMGYQKCRKIWIKKLLKNPPYGKISGILFLVNFSGENLLSIFGYFFFFELFLQ